MISPAAETAGNYRFYNVMALHDIIGQDRAVQILRKTIGRGRLPSSYLFAGESGIGKKLTAVSLAKALNCLNPGQGTETLESDSCDFCISCRKIDSGTHPDFLFIAPEGGRIRIEEIRAIDNRLSLKALEGRYKVVIVDDADAMNQFAANAFLKTLEEPPDDSLIILVTSNPDSLPDTIRSRCSRINFAPLSHEDCGHVIERAFSQQAADSRKSPGQKGRKSPRKQPPPDSERLALLMRLSMGRPGRVISGDILEERDWFLQLFRDMLHAEKDGWASREEMERWFEMMFIFLRDMVFVKMGRDSELINSDLREYLHKLSSSLDIKVIIESYQRLHALKGYLFFNLNKSLTWNYSGALLRTTMGDINA